MSVAVETFKCHVPLGSLIHTRLLYRNLVWGGNSDLLPYFEDVQVTRKPFWSQINW